MSKLEAGSELDALVAEKVMKWPLGDQAAEVWFTVAPDAHVFRHDWEGKSEIERKLLRYNLRHWSPSTDIAAAWEVVEKLSLPKGVSFGVIHLFGGAWSAYTYSEDGGLDIDAEADTAPLAICRAALATVA